jgi:ferrous iron transport protein A
VKHPRNKDARAGIDKDFRLPHTETMLQLSGNSAATLPSLMDLRKGDAAVLESIDLCADDARRLMELGFLPGAHVTAGCCAPGGDPRVFHVDGSEIALRSETARKLKIRSESVSRKAVPSSRNM